jgi:hypothetical protein
MDFQVKIDKFTKVCGTIKKKIVKHTERNTNKIQQDHPYFIYCKNFLKNGSERKHDSC